MDIWIRTLIVLVIAIMFIVAAFSSYLSESFKGFWIWGWIAVALFVVACFIAIYGGYL